MKRFNYNEVKKFISYGKDSVHELFSRKWYRQIPNMLTFSRAISPLIVIPLVICRQITLSFWVIGIFALTDLLDGFISRKFNMISEFGKRLDPMCDKIFVINAIIPLVPSYKGLLITIVMEFLIASVNAYSMLKNNSPKTSFFGKIKTLSLCITLVLGYLMVLDKGIQWLFFFFLGFTTFMQTIALCSYYMIDKKKTKSKQNRRSKD